jgi:hypothetical protein
VLHDAEIRIPTGKGELLRAHASGIQISGLGLGLRDGDPLDQVDRIVVRDLRTDAGAVRIVQGSLELRREGGELHVEGRAAASSGGHVDVRGELSSDSPHVGRLRFYVDALRVPLPAPVGRVDLSGVAVVDRRGQESDAAKVTLIATAPRESDAPPWLVAEVAGTLKRVSGRWNPEQWLNVRGEIRALRSEPSLWALHGPFRGSLTLRGTVEETEGRFRMDLNDLRVRAGEEFDKPAGVPASVALAARLRRGVPVRADGWIRVSRLRARLDAEWNDGWRWGLQTGWCPVRDVRARVPALADPILDGGDLRIHLRGAVAGAVTVDLEVRDLGLAGGLVRVPGARLRVADGRARLEPTRWELGSEHITVSAELHRRDDSPIWQLALAAAAARLDVDPILALLPQEIGPEGPPTDSEETIEATVRWLHTHSYLVRDLTIRPARLEVDAVHGDGIPEQPLSVDATLEDRLLRVRLNKEAREADRRELCLDLKHWRPRLHRSRPDTDRCSQDAPGSVGG